MNVSLSRKLQGFLKKKVRTGRYQTASEVVREGVRLIEDRDDQSALQLRRLRAEIQVGLDEIEKGQVAPPEREQDQSRGPKTASCPRA